MKKYLSLFLALVMLVTAIPFACLSASAEGFKKGDVNRDGQETAMDARLVLQAVAGIATLDNEQSQLANMDGNNIVSAIDARWILRDVAGLSNDIETDTDQMRSILRLFGYEYDEEQNVYYTSLNAWQRNFGFSDLYDDAAVYTNMRYQTLKIDFKYASPGDDEIRGTSDDGEMLLWRLQWWKGQYGVLEGAEMGVYTKKPENVDTQFYKCAEDENLLEMSFEYYQTPSDYNAGKPLFTRGEEDQEHWWTTGFKFGMCNPAKNVIKAYIYDVDKEMADGIEEGLKNVTDKEGKPNGFVEYRPWLDSNTSNFYVRTKQDNGKYRFEVVWKDAGYTNYSNSSDNSGSANECEHTNTSVTIVAATATENGYKEVMCDSCGKVVEYVVYPATGA